MKVRDQRQRLAIFFCVAAILCLSASAFGQYRGEPVKRERLVQVLRSKQFQSRDIVQIIQENGVDFKLTQAAENQLVAAGARPPVLDAVKRNYRSSGNGPRINNTVGAGKGTSDYAALLNDAVDAYDVKHDMGTANSLLQKAVTLQPSNPRAYQLLGFLNLYGNRNFDAAEKYWKRSIALGGSAVLRVLHDHDGGFINSCNGSLYITKNMVRFESDNNDHTFETSDRNIKKIEVNNRWKRLIQLKGGSFKIVLIKEDEKEKYGFAPLSGKTDESKMIIRLIGK